DVVGLNLATEWTTEVGSTFKPITVSCALDLGVVGPDERFELPKSSEWTIGGKPYVVRDAHEGETTGAGTVVELLAHSNNPGAAECAYRIGQDAMKRLLRAL